MRRWRRGIRVRRLLLWVFCDESGEGKPGEVVFVRFCSLLEGRREEMECVCLPAKPFLLVGRVGIRDNVS